MNDWKLLLRHRDFRRLWLALIADNLGTWCVIATLPILVAERFGTGNALVITLGLRLLPRIVLAPLAGMLLQRFGARRTGAAALALTGLLTAALPWCHGFAALQGAILATGMLDVFVTPAMLALRSPVTPRGLELAGNTVFASADRLAKFVGPAIGGLAVSVGFAIAYAGFGAAILLAAVWLVRLPSPPAATASETQTQSLRIGSVLRDFAMILRRDPILRALLYMAVPYMVTLGGMRPFLFWANTEWFGASDTAWTGLLAAQGIGALIGAIVSSVCCRAILRRLSTYELLLATSLLEGVAHLALLCAGTPSVAMLLLVLTGVPEMVAYAAYITCVQERLPSHLQSIFYSLQQPLFDGAMALGIASASLHADHLLSLATYWALLSAFSTVPVLPPLLQHLRAGRMLPMAPHWAEQP